MDTSHPLHDIPPAAGHDRGEARTAPFPVLTVDPAGVVTSLNPAAAALLPRAAAGTVLRGAAPAWLAKAHERLWRASAGPDRPAACGPVGDLWFRATPVLAEDGGVAWWLADETARHAAERRLAEERRQAAVLAEVSGALLATLNAGRCMELVARLAAEHLADAAVVVAPALGRGLPVAVCGPDGTTTHQVLRAEPDAVPGLEEALRGRLPSADTVAVDPALLPGWVLPHSPAGPVTRASLTPLPGQGLPAGALLLLDTGASDGAEGTRPGPGFTRLFAIRAGAALSAARLNAEQAAITATLMRGLLPPDLTAVHGVEYAGVYRPSGASERVGGDFYDVHPGAGPDDETLVVLGDVCGKGLEAAVLTGKIRNTLQALLPLADDHQRLLGLLNGALLTPANPRFATLALASVVRDGPLVRLRVTSAGHQPPVVVRRSGEVEEVPTQGTLVGAFRRIGSTTVEVVLEPGETCVFFTDGVTEARGGPMGDEMFGQRRLEAGLSRCAGMPVHALVDHVHMLAAEWIGGNDHDDIAVVAVGAPFRGTPEEGPTA
ncbi:PP2C family protein-serine/threonine phosphatase [Streptomyces chilikensis]|uniref:PP2C family protein-serine/threonine phosphatase n=1 Tax=Streptomyces chilikensis TaxID=1194079 RepID=UPI001407301F|nr:PP2C family protein-serine/threonine phosphatase [Streptomyces chilikensis]